MCSINYSEAVDLVNRRKVWQVFSEIRVPAEFLLIRDLFDDGCARVRVKGELTVSLCLTKGVRQGHIQSPILFNI